MRDRKLYERIRDAELGPWPDAAFVGRVARQNGWAGDFAADAVRHYRRFLYLALVAKQEISPSAIIDAVWHVHLEDEKAYADFCLNVLGRYLDHRPGHGRTDARGLYAQYRAALVLYEEEFSEPPDVVFWPIDMRPLPAPVRLMLKVASVALVFGFIIGVGAGQTVLALLSGVGALALYLLSLERLHLAGDGKASSSSGGGGAECGASGGD